MGCTVSRVVRDEEAPAALRPVQRKIEEIKRRNRLRMGSISAVKLLHPVEPEEEDAPLADKSLTKVVTATFTTDMKATEKPDQVDEEKGRKLGSSLLDEELPGSPSFRYYCVAVMPVDDTNCVGVDSDSFRAPGQVNKNDSKQEDNPGQYQRNGSNEPQNPGEKHLEAKLLEKKEKGRKFRGLLNVQNCYCSRPAMEVNGRDESPGLIIGKVV